MENKMFSIKNNENENIVGLSDQQVRKEIEKGNVNGNHMVKTKSIKAIIMENSFTLFNMINIVLAGCIIMVKSYKNMTFLLVAIINLIIGIVQEIRAKRMVDKMSLLCASNTTVIRNGKQENIPNENIVLGDVVIFKNGNQISVDALVIDGQCEMDESLLTGESDTVNKQSGDILLSGSFVTSGYALAKAVKVGKDSYVNNISEKVKYIKKSNSQMLSSIKIIIKILSFCIFPLSATILYRQMNFAGQNFRDAIVSTVAAIIGMIPSGLILLISIVLAASVIRLSRKKALVQDMYCIETLARVDVLCLDKTGTLTEGKLKVENVIYYQNAEKTNEELSEFLYATKDDNSTIKALREYYKPEKGNFVINSIKSFSSARKKSSVEFSHGEYILGAPEMIINNMEEYNSVINENITLGKRVLAFVKKDNNKNQLLAFIILGDVVRSSAKETLTYFKEQNVDIRIISGDNPITVMNIAKEAGVEEYDKWIDLSKVDRDEQVVEAAKVYKVFGRVTPNQKLVLVNALKEQGHTVAMTGDGVNDVLALKEADCSIAMQSGSEAARNISKIVLLDSDFSVMPDILKEGRRSINNIERSASLFLVKTIYAFLLGIIFAFINVPYPFSPIQLTLISSCSIGIPSFILAMEPNTLRVKGVFLVNIMKKSVPGGLLIVMNIMVGLVLSFVLGATKGQTSTICTYMTATSAMIVLLKVCIPFTLIRGIMYGTLITALLGGFGLFKDIFNTTKIHAISFIVLGIMCVFSLFMYYFLSVCVERIMNYFVKSDRKIG